MENIVDVNGAPFKGLNISDARGAPRMVDSGKAYLETATEFGTKLCKWLEASDWHVGSVISHR